MIAIPVSRNVALRAVYRFSPDCVEKHGPASVTLAYLEQNKKELELSGAGVVLKQNEFKIDGQWQVRWALASASIMRIVKAFKQLVRDEEAPDGV